MKMIPKGETHSCAFAEFGKQWGDSFVVGEDLVVLTQEEYDSLTRIARSAQPMCDALKSVLVAHKEIDATITAAL